jgi:hypothetical protein
MQYVLFGGIFCLPIVVCLSLFLMKALDRFRREEAPATGRIHDGRLHEFDSRESDLVESFFHTPAEKNLLQ